LLHAQSRLIEISKLPHHEQQKPLGEMEAEMSDSTNSILNGNLLHIKMGKSDCWSQALLRTTTVALACERYRIRFGDWPATFNELL
jgi:hypothetical protein